MIFQDFNEHNLAMLLHQHMDRPTWPGLKCPGAVERARAYAQQSGLWERIAAETRPSPLPVLRYSDYQHYQRSGMRGVYDKPFNERLARTHWHALAVWLHHPAADLASLHDLLWAWCESPWTTPACDREHIGLVDSETGRMLAEYAWLFADRLEARLRDRIHREISQRLLDVAFDWRKPDWWRTTGNNWNSVCNGNLIQIAFYEIRDSGQLANFIHPLFRRMDYALAYFTPDGGCVEGPGYWEYGFGHFIDAALTLYQRTNGEINLVDNAHVKRICRFPLAVHLRGNLRATFADSDNGYVGTATALKINHLTPVPDLFELVESTADGLPILEDIRGLALYQGQRHPPETKPVDCLLPQLQFAKLHAGQVILAAIAGRNDVAHNHNDIGSFILVAGQTVFLTDPGAPIYTTKTFGPNRYEMLFCRSRGHSVPLINGHEQSAGTEFGGTIRATNLNMPSAKLIEIAMARAYGDPTLISLIRAFRPDPTGQVQMTDAYEFTQTPTALQEAFITFELVVISADGQSATIGGAEHSLRLRGECPGRFTVAPIAAAQHEGRDQRPVNRVVFSPVSLQATMQLVFTMLIEPTAVVNLV